MAVNSDVVQTTPKILNISPDGSREALLVEDSSLLFSGEYSREGFDLQITSGDNHLVIQGYFEQSNPPDLVAQNGGVLTHDVVAALAGPLAPAQYAQGAINAALTKIGEVIKLDGSASAKNTDGVESELSLGSPVYQGDVVSTGGNSSLGISFIDKTLFSLSSNARMVLDELVYNPGAPDDSSMVFNLVEGAFVFVTGEVAPTGNMTIETPVATMGIRGTTPTVWINAILGIAEFSILPDPDIGKVGSYVLVSKKTGALLATVDASGEKYTVTALVDQAVKNDKSSIELQNDEITLDEIREIFFNEFGKKTELDGTNTFAKFIFKSSSSTQTQDDNQNNNGDVFGSEDIQNLNDVAIHDDPPDALDDTFLTLEDTVLSGGKNLIDGSGGGIDSDPEGQDLTVTHINGEALVFIVGIASIKLPSGAILLINAAGDITYDANDAYDFLGLGDKDTDKFTYTIADPAGNIDTATATVKLTGQNDQPQITNLTTSIHNVSFTEAADSDSFTTTRNAFGVVNFTDIDSSDTHTASFDTPTFIWIKNGVEQSINPFGTISALLSETSPTLNPTITFAPDGTIISVPDPVTGNVKWKFTVSEQDLDFLGVGEKLQLTAKLTVADSISLASRSGTTTANTVSQDVVITVIGTNDAPIIAAATGTAIDTATITELNDNDSGENSLTHIQTGNIAFDDVDVSDTHKVTSTPDAKNPTDLASANFILTNSPTTAGKTAGDFGWKFSVDDADLEFLAANETRIYKYELEVDDNNGGTDQRIVTITVIGTNDAPIIAAATGTAIDTATVTELNDNDSGENSLTHIQTGNIAFDDVDVSDTHKVTSTPDAKNPTDLASANFILTNSPTTAGKTVGDFGWKFSVDDADLEFLAANETRIYKYELEVDDNNGGTDQRIVTITVIGTNDAPIIAAATGTAIDTATVTELNDNDSGENSLTHIQTGNIAFDDVDVSDTHKVTSTPDAKNPTDLASANFILTNSPTTAGKTVGDFGWKFSVDDADLEFLAANETRIYKYELEVDDNNGGTDQRIVTITVIGTNDAPIIAAATGTAIDTATVTELNDNDSGENSLTHIQTGNIAFDDVDVSDTHKVTSTPDAKNPTDLASANFVLTNSPTTAGKTTGDFGWKFSVDDADLEFLAANETRIYKYELEVDDNNGGTDQRIVTITVIGTNDAPIIAAATGTAIDTATVTELNDNDSGENSLTHIQTGNIAFDDVDVSDTHKVTSTPDAKNPTDLASANFILTNSPTTAGKTAGDFGWKFSVDDADLEFLAANETRIYKYELEVDDNNGGTDQRIVTITVIGTNDAPELSIAAGPGPIQLPENTEISDIIVSDIDNSQLTGASVKIATNFIMFDETLLFTDQAGIAGKWDNATGTLILTGNASLDAYQAALRSITYSSVESRLSALVRDVVVEVYDGIDSSNLLATNVPIPDPIPAVQIGAAEYFGSGGFTGTNVNLVDHDELFTASEGSISIGLQEADPFEGGGNEFVIFDNGDDALQLEPIIDFDSTVDTINLASFLDNSSDPNSAIEIQDTGSDSVLRINSVDTVTLTGVNVGEIINIIYDPDALAITETVIA